MPEASAEEEGWDAHAATGNEEEGRETDAAATENDSDYFEEEGDDTTEVLAQTVWLVIAEVPTRLLRRERRRWRQGRTGRHKCSPTSQMLSLRSRQVAYHWRLDRWPQGTACK